MLLTPPRLNALATAALAALSLAACSPKEEAATPAAPAATEVQAPTPPVAAQAPSPLASVLMLATQSASAPGPGNDWDRVAKFSDVNWKWGADKVGQNDDTMEGTLPASVHKIPDLPDFDIKVSGARTIFLEVSAGYFSPQGIGFGPEDLNLGTLTRIRTTCDDDSASNSLTFHKVEAAGMKPFFLMFQSSGGSGSTEAFFSASDSEDRIISGGGAPGEECKKVDASSGGTAQAQQEPVAMPPIPAGEVDRVRDLTAQYEAKGGSAPAQAPSSPAPAPKPARQQAPTPSQEETFVDGQGINGQVYAVKQNRILAICTDTFNDEVLASTVAQAAASGPVQFGSVMTNRTYAKHCKSIEGDFPVDNIDAIRRAKIVATSQTMGYFVIKMPQGALAIAVPKR